MQPIWHRSSLGRCRRRCGARSNRWFRCGNGHLAASTSAGLGLAASRCRPDRYFRRLCTYFEPGVSGRRCPRSMAAPAPCTRISSAGSRKASSLRSGRPVWPNTTGWRVSPGAGRAWTGRWAGRPWRKSAWDRTPRIGEKNGRKRSLLVDARGVPLSLVGSRANVHDSKLLEPTLKGIVCRRPEAQKEPSETLCVDAGYVGYPVLVTSRKQNYKLNLKTRAEERKEKPAMLNIKRGGGLWNEPTPGSIASANCWSVSRKPKPATWLCYNSPPLLSVGG